MDLPVQIVTKHVYHNFPSVKIYFPVVTSLPLPPIQKKINRHILKQLNTILIDQGFYNKNLVEMVGNYEIKTNERGFLSLSLTVYSLTGGAHGLTITRSLTFDITTGKQYALEDLFKPTSDYVRVLSQIIEKKFIEWEVPLLEEFKGIRPDQDFYVADHSLVIYFQVYELTPYVYGFPYVPISIKDIEEIILPNGILDKLLSF